MPGTKLAQPANFIEQTQERSFTPLRCDHFTDGSSPTFSLGHGGPTMTRGAKIVVFSVVGLLAFAAFYYGYLAPSPSNSTEASAPRVNESSTLTQAPASVLSPAAGVGTLPAIPIATPNSALSGPAFAASTNTPSTTPSTTVMPKTAIVSSPTAAGGGTALPTAPTSFSPATIGTTNSVALSPSQANATQSSRPAPVRPATVTVTTAKPKDTAYTSYTVKSGDTLTGIAGEWFRDTNKWTMIADANPGINPSSLKVGQKINLPARAGLAAERPTVSSAKPPIEVSGPTATSKHVVVAGETLGSIAGKVYGNRTSWKQIYDANKTLIGSDPSRIQVGMALVIPTKQG
ncbi:MAG: LysM peptidoglycan-binding domain-containing protein [Phycisphaerales bacterium]|nr:LysM peptidoglycan-binding domain-containing protein [Phycisphaerales bacterium]